VLVGDDHRALLSDFGLAGFDRSRWNNITSNSSDPGGTIAYMAPELFHRAHEEGQYRVPLRRKEADVYALGMLSYEVRLLIADFCDRTLTTVPGPDWRKTVLWYGPRSDHIRGFRWETAPTTFIYTDPRPDLGNGTSMLEWGADAEANSRARPHNLHGSRIAERTSGVACKEPFQGCIPVPSHECMDFSAESFRRSHRADCPIEDRFRHLSMVLQPHQRLRAGSPRATV